jgi:hypothetical protein
MKEDFEKCRKIIREFIKQDEVGNHIDDLLSIALSLVISGFTIRANEYIMINGSAITADNLLLMLKTSLNKVLEELCGAIVISSNADENIH